jgi:hypothetical protein
MSIYVDCSPTGIEVGTYIAPYDLDTQFARTGDFVTDRRRWKVAGPFVMNMGGLESYIRDTVARFHQNITIITTQALLVRPFLCLGQETPRHFLDPDELMRAIGTDAEAAFRFESGYDQDAPALALKTSEMRAEEMYFRAIWAIQHQKPGAKV